MNAHPEARAVLEGVDLVQGLGPAEVHDRLRLGARLREAGSRILAFYLAEMAVRKLYQLTGHGSTARFAEARLGLDRRRRGELIAVGHRLLELPAIDGAFLDGRLVWSKVVELVKVATPGHERAWLAKALACNCKDLAREVMRARAGGPPRDPHDRKGLPEVRFPLHARVDQETHDLFEQARERLSAELGRPVTSGEVLRTTLLAYLEGEGGRETEEAEEDAEHGEPEPVRIDDAEAQLPHPHS